MRTKWIVAALAAVFALALTAADNSGKKYRISLSQTVRAGNTDLAAGDYHVVLGSPKVRFIHIGSGNEFEVEANVQTSDKKHPATAITTSRTGDAVKLSRIEIGGSTADISFP